MFPETNGRTPKQHFQAQLIRFGLYQRLRGSWVYDAYWQIADRRLLADRSREVDFYRRVLNGLPQGGLILDVGANHGAKTDIFLRLGARVVAVEPDEANQQILHQRFLTYRLFRKEVVVVGKALSDRETVETMWIDAPGSAKNTLSRKWVETLRADGSRFGQPLEFSQKKKVETTTIDHLISLYGIPHFVKIDVEGFEPNVLRGLHHPIPYLSFEVNLPEFKHEGMECVQQLERLAIGGTFNYTTDCRKGLVLKHWVSAKELSHELHTSSESSVEVFWTTSRSGQAL